MFIHVSRSGDLFFVTITTEVPDSSEGSTVTFRLTRQDADYLSKQLGHEVTDWHVENDGDEYGDPHEAAAMMADYYDTQAEIINDLSFANEPF
jgi:hypothetical protein